MKKILTGSALLLLLYVCSVWYSRTATEQTLDDIAQFINAYPGYTATVAEMQHNLFSSKAILNLKLDPSIITNDMDPVDRVRFSEQLGYLEKGLNLNLDIHRGPLVFLEGIYPGLYKVIVTVNDDIQLLDEFLGADFNLNDYFSFVASMNYFGNGNVKFNIVEFNRDVGDGKLEWAGMDHEYRLGDYGLSYAIDGVVHPVSYSSSENRLETSAMLITGEGHFPAAGTFIADTNGSIDMAYILATVAGQEIFRLEDLQISVASSKASDERFSFSYGIGTGSIAAVALPENINRLRFDFGINDMSINGFNNFYTAAMNFSGNMDPMQSQTLAMQGMASLLEGNPEFVLKELGISMGSDKEFNLSSRLRLGENFLTNVSMAMMNPSLLLNSLELEITASFTQPIMEMLLQVWARNQLGDLALDPQSLQQLQDQQMRQMNAMVLQAVQNGFLKQQGNRYELTATIANGTATVNSMPIPIPQMQ